MVMFATMALLPPMLQGLFGYDVIDTGMVLMPRGVGVLISMQLSGLLMRKGVDARWMVSIGFLIGAWSLWQMAGWSLEVDRYHLVLSGADPGPRHRPGVHPAQRHRLRHPAAAAAHRRLEPAQPDALGRLVDRHLDHDDAAFAQHADQPQRPRRPRHPGDHRDGRPVVARTLPAIRRGRARRCSTRGHPPGGDDRLRRRLLADDVAQPRRRCRWCC